MYNNKNNRLMCVLVILMDWTANACIFIFIKSHKEQKCFFPWIELHIYKWNWRGEYINLVRKLLCELNLHVEYSGFGAETEGSYWSYSSIKNWFDSRVPWKRLSYKQKALARHKTPLSTFIPPPPSPAFLCICMF